jgi:sec-independent protein translocase protein TatA
VRALTAACRETRWNACDGGLMGGLSIWHWMVVLLVVLMLFGGGKVSNLMGDFAKGIKAFKKNMAEDDDESMEASDAKAAGSITGPDGKPATTTARETTKERAST